MRTALLVIALAGAPVTLTPRVGWADAADDRCTLDAVDRVACMAGRLCACRFVPGSPATGLTDGYRWDCGILRPRCGGEVPATIDAWQGSLPDALSLDQSRTIVHQGTGGKPYPLRR